MFSPNNAFNSPDSLRHFQPTRILQGAKTRNLVTDLIPGESSGILVVDNAFADDGYTSSFQTLMGERLTATLVVSGEPTRGNIDTHLHALGTSPDWIVAIGGGSTIDTAKAIAAAQRYDAYARIGYGDARYITDEESGSRPLLIAIPTTAGTGSETSRYFLVSDNNTKEKMVSRAWALCPAYAVLDPYFLAAAPTSVLVSGAFDAFTHLWETYICRYEQSAWADMLSLEGISRGLDAISKVLRDDRSDRVLSDLQMVSAMGGIALSNVRTGLLHTAGEALSAQASLSHAETLMVFFTESLKYYRDALEDRLPLLMERINRSASGAYPSIEELGTQWMSWFDQAGITARMRTVLSLANPSPQPVVDALLRDRVLTTKESPREIDASAAARIVGNSLEYWSKQPS